MNEPMRSSLYEGWVTHVRTAAPAHRFRYRVSMALLDVDELPAIDRSLRLFGYNRSRPVAFHDADHFGGTEHVRAAAERLVPSTDAKRLGRVRILTQLRTLGHVFNPVSILWCDWMDESPAAHVAEVNNTFGDRHCYVLPAGVAGATSVAKKRMHVSPFFGLEGSYRFEIPSPDAALRIGIDLTVEGDPKLRSRLCLRRRPLTDAALARALVRRPLSALHVLGAIHFEAWRLWRKRAPFRPRPPYDPASAGRLPA